MKGYRIDLIRKLLSFWVLFLGAVTVVQADDYDVVKRYKILEDRFKTQEMLRPIGHNFFLDISGSLNKNLLDVLDDAKKVDDVSDSQKLQTATDFLNKYENTEQTINAKIALGTPLPSFNLFGVSLKPNLRASYNLGGNIGIRKGILDAESIFDIFSEELPDAIANAVRARMNGVGYSQGDDIVALACLDAGLALPECTELAGDYLYPDPNVPNLYVLAKQDVKAGFFSDYKIGEHFFGKFNIYGLHRTDIYVRITEQDLVKDTDIIDLGNIKNSEIHTVIDYELGYTNKDLSVSLGVEELKLATLKDRKAGAKATNYGNDALIRLHADYLYKLSHFSVKPFVGLHKRKGYDLDEGLYAGADMGFHLWGDRLGLVTRGMVDKEHFTFSPQIKLWLLQFEYMLKIPLQSEVDNVKTATLHGVNLRFFF